MKHTLKNATLCIAVAFMFFNALLCMDEPENKDVVLEPVIRVLSFLLTDGLGFFDHQMICSLAVNRECEKVLQETAPARRAYFTKQIPQEFFQTIPVIWHKYGSACGNIYIGEVTTILDNGTKQCKRYPYMRCNFLQCGRKCVSHSWDGVQERVPGFEYCRFNEQGDFCFYCFEQEKNYMLHGKNRHILEYRLSQKPSRSIHQYVVKDSHPGLCRKQVIVATGDYREFIPTNGCKPFEDLPKKIQAAVSKCCNEQQKK